MGRIFRDYFSVNAPRIRREFFTMYLLFLAGTLLVMVQRRSEYHASLVTLGILAALFWAAAFALFVIVMSAIDAYQKASRAARSSGLSIDEYVKSAEYGELGREKLKRTDKEVTWLRK